jgi:hypothetical protein
MKFPEIPAKGDFISRRWAIQLLDYLRSTRLQPSGNAGGILVKETANGTILSLRRAQAEPTVARGAQILRTFFTYDASTSEAFKVRVTSGAINDQIWTDDDEEGFTVINGDIVYLHVGVDDDGLAESIGIGVNSSLPDNTDTDGYTPLATISITGSGDDEVMNVIPLAWNYSQMQMCGPETYLWGGFGG